MDIDPYAPCPGGIDKKVKFCCPDLTAELDKLSRMVSGDQRAAALDLADQLDAKYPNRACLLSTKAMLEAGLGQPEKAAATVARFHQQHPTSPVALAESAMLTAHDDPHAAVDVVQQAFEHALARVPMQLYEALGVVGVALVEADEVVAARAHWMLQFGLSGGKDEQILRMLVQVQSSPDVHLLLKHNQPLVEAPADALWKRTFDAILEKGRNGRWAAAAAEFQALADKAGAWPAIEHNIAVLQSWMAHRAQAVAAWRSYAAGDVPLDDAVEALGIAQLLDRDAADLIDVVRAIYPIRDFETLLAGLGSHSQALRMPVDLRALVAEGEVPPKGCFSLLDRPKPDSGANLTMDNVPLILGQVLVYGKQTDREAIVELVTGRTDLAACQAAFQAVAGGAIGPVEKEEVAGQLNAIDDLLSLKWHVPDDVSLADRQALLLAGYRQQLLGRWPEFPQRALGGKTPRAAAADPGQQKAVLAAILILDLRSDSLLAAADYNDLRRSLGLPEAGLIDPAGLTVLELPYARLARLDASKLTDHDLLLAHDRAREVRFLRAVQLLGREIIRRPSLDKELDKSTVYGLLAQLEPDLQKATADLDEARRIAEAAGKSSARFDLIELTIAMGHGELAKADQLLHHIRDQHLREPGIAQALYSLLAQWGVVRPDGAPPAAAAAQPSLAVPGAAAPEAASKLWTPGGDSAAPGGKKSTIWTPGMD